MTSFLLSQLTHSRELNEQLSLFVQLSGFAAAIILGRVLPYHFSKAGIGFLTGFFWSAIVGYILIGGEGGILVVVFFPIICTFLASVGKAWRGDDNEIFPQ